MDDGSERRREICAYILGWRGMDGMFRSAPFLFHRTAGVYDYVGGWPQNARFLICNNKKEEAVLFHSGKQQKKH